MTNDTPQQPPEEAPVSRDEEYWAKPVTELRVAHDLPVDAINLNVEGKRIAGVTGGFGKMWQKVYRIELEGTSATPQEVVKTWKAHFGDFWPKGNRFFGPLTSISPGDVALLNVALPGKVKLSTGIIVIYADDESFSFMTPEGHMFSGMITFSARQRDGVTVAQIDALIRAQDPLYEIGMPIMGHRNEDRFWKATLQALGRYFGVDATATMERMLVDRKRQWKNFGNIRKSAAIRSGFYMLGAPFRAMKGSKNTTGA